MKQLIQLKNYSPDESSSNVYGMKAMKFTKNGGKFSWGPADDLNNSNIGIDLTIGGDFLPDINDLVEILTIGSVDRNTFLVYKNNGVYRRHGDAIVSKVPPRNSPGDQRGWPIQFNENIYIVYENGVIINYEDDDSGAVLTTNLELNGTKINQVLVWQGRVFISHGNQVSWCDVNTITVWDIGTTQNETLAGYNAFPGEAKIRDIVVFGDTLYVFGEDKIHRASVSDVDSQFEFIELSSGNQYAGGAIGFQNSVYYVSKSGIRAVNPSESVPISETLDEYLSLLLSSDPEILVNYNEANNEISWLFKGEDIILTLDVKYLTFTVKCDPSIIAFGQVGIAGKTIGELILPLERYGETIGSFGIGKPRASAIDSSGVIYFYGPQEMHSIDFNYGRFSNGTRIFIREILIDDLSGLDYDIQIKDRNYDIDFTETYTKDKWGVCVIERDFEYPDIRININEPFKEINNIEINYVVEKM